MREFYDFDTALVNGSLGASYRGPQTTRAGVAHVSIIRIRASSLHEKTRKFLLLLRRQFAQRLKADTIISNGATVLIYNPYLSVLGGGERYTFALAGYLQQKCKVTIASPELPALAKMQSLGFPTTYEFQRIQLPYFPEASQDYDAVIYVTIEPPRLPWLNCPS
jgi:hypothetical protein